MANPADLQNVTLAHKSVLEVLLEVRSYLRSGSILRKTVAAPPAADKPFRQGRDSYAYRIGCCLWLAYRCTDFWTLEGERVAEEKYSGGTIAYLWTST
jgi:hypothetical protein